MGFVMGFVGSGVMAEAMIMGALGRQLAAANQIIASHPRSDRRSELEARLKIRSTADNLEAAQAQVVVLSVKPQVLSGVLDQLRGKLAPDQLVISIVAGASSRMLASRLDHQALVLAMPNTPAQIDAGVTVWYATTQVTSELKARAKSMLEALGKAYEVDDERFVNMATAVSGTGPTYFFLVIEALIDAAVHLGFPRHVAHELVLETMLGSARFAIGSQAHPAQLKDMVTSPGGTSAAALYALESGGLRTVLSDAVWAAYERTLTLAAALEEGRPPSARRGSR